MTKKKEEGPKQCWENNNRNKMKISSRDKKKTQILIKSYTIFIDEMVYEFVYMHIRTRKKYLLY